MTDVLTVKPRRALLGQGLLAAAMIVVPVFAVLLWLSRDSAAFPYVVGLLAATVLAAAVWAALFLSVEVRVSGDEIVRRTIWGRRVTIPVSGVSRSLVLDLHRTMATQAHPQLFVLDDDERALVRLRGEYWGRHDMELLVGRLRAPVQRLQHPVTLGELQVTNPHMLYWFERKPSLRSE
ncbi:hypothetical protein ALI44B_06535 [Leifsonia sp. ALI-44-B]|uniref:hypothetical protein n=1 Tax=Leifsonia sp. ALI-44-B TaxID=1933776 RepID=UPI00097C057D|nr:hypothetical protein [Leifsonia sp. ALI-44-B]ONI64209.1 hypothetical protein ALI44B_06535 [Leifsonia sp. ALI-44-B]